MPLVIQHELVASYFIVYYHPIKCTASHNALYKTNDFISTSSVDGNDCPARGWRDNDFFFAIDPLANARGYFMMI
jgi:hypothetical protein